MQQHRKLTWLVLNIEGRLARGNDVFPGSSIPELTMLTASEGIHYINCTDQYNMGLPNESID